MKKEHWLILAALVLLYLWWKQKKPTEDVTVDISFPNINEAGNPVYSNREAGGDLLSRIVATQGDSIRT